MHSEEDLWRWLVFFPVLGAIIGTIVGGAETGTSAFGPGGRNPHLIDARPVEVDDSSTQMPRSESVGLADLVIRAR